VLLAVSLADCVPVFLADPMRGVVALLHAGWRGAAAGILEVGLSVLGDRFGSRAEDLALHLGPSICGECYEVGPEVFDALGAPIPDCPDRLDLRAILARRAVSAGIRTDEITFSGACTRCGDSSFFSHRAGDEERHLGLIGIRPSDVPPGLPR
jgi:YfiH family protein